MMVMAREIGDVIKNLREKQGWSQNKLEREAGLPKGSVSRYESGKRGAKRPDVHTVRKIAYALSVPPDALLKALRGQHGGADVIRLASTRRPTPNLDQAVEMVREHVSLAAIQRARDMAASSGVDLSVATWVAVLTDIDRRVEKS